MNILEKIDYLKGKKEAIRQSIINKGVEVPENTPFKDYAGKIGAIPTSTDDWTY